MYGQNRINNELLETGLYNAKNGLQIRLVDNQKNYEVYQGENRIFRKGACWATFYEVMCLVEEI